MVDLTGLRNRKFHELLAQQASSAAPTPSWGAALARALQGGVAGLIERGDNESEMEANKWHASLIGQQAAAQPAQSSPLAAAMSQPQPQAMSMSDGNMPRGYRNNNPLNIEAGNFTQGQPGFAGSDGRFAKFASLDQGTAAANKLLDVYQNKHGLNTVSGVVGRWAPAGDGNNVSAYAANVAKQLGIDPNAPIPPEMRPQLVAAMAQHENGRPMPQRAAPPQQAPQQIAQAPDANAALRAQIQQGLTSTNERIRQLAQPYAAGIVGKQLEGDKPTDEIREYNLYKQQGGNKSFFDYKADLKKAGSTQVIQNVDQKQESAFSVAASQHQAKRFDELAGEAPAAKQMQSDVSMLRDLGEKIKTGKLAEFKAVIGPYADVLGIKVDNLSEIQAFEAVVNRVAPQLRVKGTGAQSDFELRNFIKQMPSIGNTPEGNALIDKTMQGFVQNKMTAAEIGSMALNGEITRKDADKRLRELPDPMAEWREHQKTMKKAAEPTVIDGYKIRVK
jgi:hypothetical protein